MNKGLADLVLEIMKTKQFKEGLDMIPQQDIKEEISARVDATIEQLMKEGDLYKPRHHFLRLTQRER